MILPVVKAIPISFMALVSLSLPFTTHAFLRSASSCVTVQSSLSLHNIEGEAARLDHLPVSLAPHTKREITVSHVEWSSYGLLQHYHGVRLPPQPFHVNRTRMQGQYRASQPLDPSQLQILYRDDSMAVVHKPSGILSVPGPRRNPNMANLLHQVLQLDMNVDHMVVHRLDMDTSGIVVYALTPDALRQLHQDFRERRVKKTYHALVCGHVTVAEGEINVPLERDPHHVPFMRIAQGSSSSTTAAPKPSLTYFRVISHEYLGEQLPVTRLELTPHTGRTHQLRVHCAAIGHAIVGDDIYGYKGDGGAGVNWIPDSVDASIHAMGLRLCLHAERLCLLHPVTGAPIIFSTEASF